MRGLVLLLVVVLFAGGCASQGEKYCSALREEQKQLGEILGSNDPGSLLSGLPTLRALGARAPDDLTDEWQILLNAIGGLRDALRKAGIKPSEYAGGIPASVTGQRREDVVAAADTLASADVLDAANGIETQARDVCKVNLGL